MRLLLLKACFLTALAALSTGARADTLQIFSLYAVMADGYTAQGAVVIDATTGDVATSNFTISQGGTVDATFTDPSDSTFDGFYQASFNGSVPGYLYVLLFPRASLASYTGGTLCSETSPCDGYASGSYVPSGFEPAITASLSPVPEPSSLLLLATGTLGILTLVRRRLA